MVLNGKALLLLLSLLRRVRLHRYGVLQIAQRRFTRRKGVNEIVNSRSARQVQCTFACKAAAVGAGDTTDWRPTTPRTPHNPNFGAPEGHVPSIHIQL
ncbi:hypothetical protein LIA77_02468 [Sarocladium implicatum]|nr:hypothetical protein LIA77_02468 [Sarocladium implicatum]